MISLAEMVTIVTGSGPGTGHRLGAMSFARAAALIWGSRDTTMTQYGTWVSYGGTARIVLAIVLLAAAGGVAYAGTRLPLPVRPARLGEGARTFMLVSWGLAIIAFLICLPIYVKHARREHLFHAAPADPITPVTVICVAVIFIIIFIVGRSHGWRITLASAAIGAAAAPMIFEFPFDLIVMARTYPPLPPDPASYRILFFAPLFLVEFTTLTLLTLSPMVRLSRSAFFFFALMLAVFAAWGLFGFAYPSAPVPFALNVLSKILAFVTTLSLFLPRRTPASAPGELRVLRPPSSQPPSRVSGTEEGRGFVMERQHPGSTQPDLGFWVGAGEGNRTLMTSLEGWGSAIELRPHVATPGSRARPPRG